MYLSVLNTAIHYDVYGEGFPIVCLHNAGADSSIWEYQTDFFKSNFQVIVLDLPGYGKSDRPRVPYTLEYYQQILDAFLNKLEITNCYLLGNCIGASIALHYAKINPKKVKAMALSNLCGGIQMMQSKSPFLFFRNKILPITFYHALFQFNRLIWIRKKVIQRLFGSKIKQPLFDYLTELQNHPAHNQSRIYMLQGLKSFDTFSINFEYKENHLPPFILFWGQENRVFSAAWVEKIKQRICMKKTHILQDCGHLLMYEAPEDYNSKVQQFFASSDSQKN